ncbi:MAG: helix-turn-helix domain-containing protein [Ruminococcaceae bacterium]|nr:helix-turn-helix domain-containing protein [Oscillospiraceae bacterium]
MNKTVNVKSVGGDVYFSYTNNAVMSDKYIAQHCHDGYEILYVVEGRGKYVIEGAEYPIRSGTVLFAPPFSYHSIYFDSDTQYERYVLQFFANDLTSAAREFLLSLNKSLEGVGCYYAADALSPSIVSIFERFEYADSLPEKEGREFRRLLTSEIVLLLSVATRESIPRDERELGARVIKYLNEHIEKDVSLDKLAKKFFVSKYYLCRAFKKHNGISVHGYINQKRVMYAKQLIESGETASSAAYRVGFGDYSAFYRAYVKIIGRAPTSQETEVRIDDI